MEQVNISEASRRLGVSRKTIHRRIDAGELAAVDTPEGRRVLLPRQPGTQAHAPEAHPAHVPAHSERTPDADLLARLERAEARVDQLLALVSEQNRTIQGQVIRLAQLEGRMIAAETPPERPNPVHEPDTPPRRRRGLRELYRAWRGR